MKIQKKHVNILKAALHELDLKWRNGTANAGLSEKSMRLIRVETCPHESDVRFLLDLIEGGREVHLVLPDEHEGPPL